MSLMTEALTNVPVDEASECGDGGAAMPRTGRWRCWLRPILYSLLFVLYNFYLGFAIYKNWSHCTSWCDGSKLLVVVTCLVYGCLFFTVSVKFLLKPCLIGGSNWILPSFRLDEHHRKYLKWCGYSLACVGVAGFYVIDSRHNRQRLTSFGGIFLVLLLGFIFSKHRDQVHWCHVTWALGLQFLMGVCVLRLAVGRDFFACISAKVVTFLSFAEPGAEFVFDYLASGNATNVTLTRWNSSTTNSTTYDLLIQTSFAFKVLPVIIYFSFFISILFYYGVMQRVVIAIGWLLHVTVGTTAAESLNAAASVFVGQSEAPLMISPYLELLTLSELHAVMAGGFATIAGSVFAAYISFGIDGTYLLSGALMSAPAALGLSKLIYPETEDSRTTFQDIKIEKSDEKNVLEASVKGILTGVMMACGIAASLISFIAFIHFIDSVFMWFGALVDLPFISLEWLLGQALVPFAFLMGVEWDECGAVGTLLGIKTIVNEFVAYKRLGHMELSPRSRAIATYALCSFSNIGSLGSQIAILGGLAPKRKSDFAMVGVRALFTGAGACYLTACVAGSLLEI